MTDMTRVSKFSLPLMPTYCRVEGHCVYRKQQICDEPRVNKGNGDALCHRMANKTLLVFLGESAK